LQKHRHSRESGNPKQKRCTATNSNTPPTKADNVFKQLYLRITKTKPHKVGIVAVMHKMLIIAHTLVKNNEKWENKMLKNC